MAIVDGLTTLVAVKLEAGISDTSSDALLEALISSTSAAIRAHLKREVLRATHTSEVYSVNNHQLLYLKEYPVQSVTSITLLGVTLVLNTDYFSSAEDLAAGRLYRPIGWTGNYFVRGTFPDVYAGSRDIVTTYVSGWYLPADLLYVAGAANSLPMALQYACTRAVLVRYRMALSQADGLKALTEGGYSLTWLDPTFFKAGNGGFDDITAAMLAPYVRREVM